MDESDTCEENEPLSRFLVQIVDRRPYYRRKSLMDQLHGVNERLVQCMENYKFIQSADLQPKQTRSKELRGKEESISISMTKHNLLVEQEAKMKTVHDLMMKIPEGEARDVLLSALDTYRLQSTMSEETGEQEDLLREISERKAASTNVNLALEAQEKMKENYFKTLTDMGKLRKLHQKVSHNKQQIRKQLQAANLKQRQKISVALVPSPENAQSASNVDPETLIDDVRTMVGEYVQDFSDAHVRKIEDNLEEMEDNLTTIKHTLSSMQKVTRTEVLEKKKLENNLDALKKDMEKMNNRLKELEIQQAQSMTSEIKERDRFVQTAYDWLFNTRPCTSSPSQPGSEPGTPPVAPSSPTVSVEPSASSSEDKDDEAYEEMRTQVLMEDFKMIPARVAMPTSMAEAQGEVSPGPFGASTAAAATQLSKDLAGSAKPEEEEQAKSPKPGKAKERRKTLTRRESKMHDKKGSETTATRSASPDPASCSVKDIYKRLWRSLRMHSRSCQNTAETLMREILYMRVDARDERNAMKAKEEKAESMLRTLKTNLERCKYPGYILPAVNADDGLKLVKTRVPGNHKCQFCFCHDVNSQISVLSTMESKEAMDDTLAHCSHYMLVMGTADNSYRNTYKNVCRLQNNVKDLRNDLAFEDISNIADYKCMDLDTPDSEIEDTLKAVEREADSLEQLMEYSTESEQTIAVLIRELSALLENAKKSVSSSRKQEERLRHLRQAYEITGPDLDIQKLVNGEKAFDVTNMLQGSVCPYCLCQNRALDVPSRAPLSSAQCQSSNILIHNVALLDNVLGTIFNTLHEVTEELTTDSRLPDLIKALYQDIEESRKLLMRKQREEQQQIRKTFTSFYQAFDMTA